MTGRLRQLMHEEASQLTPPAPDAAAVLAEGRRLRRRSRVMTGVAAAAVAAVVVTTAGFVALNGDDPGAKDVGPAGEAAVDAAPAAYGVGSDIHLGDAVVQVPDSVHSLHYTSVGVLVRSNPNDGASDGSGPESLTLVRWDGSTTDLGTIPEGVGPATDPDEGVYVLAEAAGDGFVAVVRDAATGDTVDEVVLPALPKSYWDVPPLALDDGTLYVGYRNETVAVDLASGQIAPVDGLAGGIPEVVGGRTVLRQGNNLVVRDVATGEDLLIMHKVEEYARGTLSPDGRFLRITEEEIGPPQHRTRVIDIATGTGQSFDEVVLPHPGQGQPYGWGWTADGDLFNVQQDTLTTCDLVAGTCEKSALSPALPANADLRLGGVTYES